MKVKKERKMKFAVSNKQKAIIWRENVFENPLSVNKIQPPEQSLSPSIKLTTSLPLVNC